MSDDFRGAIAYMLSLVKIGAILLNKYEISDGKYSKISNIRTALTSTVATQ